MDVLIYFTDSGIFNRIRHVGAPEIVENVGNRRKRREIVDNVRKSLKTSEHHRKRRKIVKKNRKMSRGLTDFARKSNKNILLMSLMINKWLEFEPNFMSLLYNDS